jgi:hypothetical protein
MNSNEPYHMPQQSFPTDVTSPAPTQLYGPKPETPKRHPDAPIPRPELDDGLEDEEQDEEGT